MIRGEREAERKIKRRKKGSNHRTGLKVSVGLTRSPAAKKDARVSQLQLRVRG